MKMARDKTISDLDIRVLVLVGKRNFGRCPISSRLPAALWPVVGTSALGLLLQHLADEGVEKVQVCCDDDVVASVRAVSVDRRLTVDIVVEELSSGTAGCLRDAAGKDPGDVIVVFSASMMCPPSLGPLIESHVRDQADLTMAFNRGSADGLSPGRPAEVYLCRPEVLGRIPAGGYSDIKEGLIPTLLREGGTVRPLVLDSDVGCFHDRAGYLDALSTYLAGSAQSANGYRFYEGSDRRITPETLNGNIDPAARVYGPVAIADQARVAGGAIVIGPAVLGEKAIIREDATVVQSVLWDGCEVGCGCEVRESLIDCGTVVPEGVVIEQQSISAATKVKARSSEGKMAGNAKKGNRATGGAASSGFGWIAGRLPAWVPFSQRQLAYAAVGVALLAAFLWSYWPILTDLWGIWHRSDEYSAGLLVPFLTIYVLWSRRRELASVPVRPAILSGIAAFAVAQATRGAGLYLMYGSGIRLSVVLSVAAIVLLLFGWRMLGRLATVLLFLCLMLPWPHRVQSAISLPLQRYSTDSAVFCLELSGYEVVQDGNVIRIGETSVAVAEACNGLRMVTAFLVITALVVLLAKRAWWEKLIVLVSSLPIALLCNTIRLTVTAIAFTILTGDHWEKLFHDFGGYAMMPLALAMVVGELWLLRRLTTPQTEVQPEVIARRKPRQAVNS